MLKTPVQKMSKDLRKVPFLTFSEVDAFVKACTECSGQRQITKGFKYYSEKYVHNILGEKHVTSVEKYLLI